MPSEKKRLSDDALYITKEGDILRGEEANEELMKKDAAELRQKYGALLRNDCSITLRTSQEPRSSLKPDSKLPANKKKASTLGVDVSAKASVGVHAMGMSLSAGNREARGAVLKSSISGKLDATGVKIAAGNLEVTAVQASLPISASGTISGVNINAAGVDLAGIDASAKLSLNASAAGVKGKIATVQASGVEASAEASARASAMGVDFQAASASFTGIEATASASASATAIGCKIKAGTINAVGIKATKQVSAKTDATGIKVNTANASFTGMDTSESASCSASATKANISATNAQVTEIQSRKTVSASAHASGMDVTCAQATVAGIKSGMSAECSAEAKGVKVQLGTAHVEGADTTLKATASACAEAGRVKMGNVNVQGFEGPGVDAKAEAVFGVEAFNVRVGGMSAKTGVSASTRIQVGNVNLQMGLPSLNISPHLNIGFGGGGCRGSDGPKEARKNNANTTRKEEVSSGEYLGSTSGGKGGDGKSVDGNKSSSRGGDSGLGGSQSNGGGGDGIGGSWSSGGGEGDGGLGGSGGTAGGNVGGRWSSGGGGGDGSGSYGGGGDLGGSDGSGLRTKWSSGEEGEGDPGRTGSGDFGGSGRSKRAHSGSRQEGKEKRRRIACDTSESSDFEGLRSGSKRRHGNSGSLGTGYGKGNQDAESDPCSKRYRSSNVDEDEPTEDFGKHTHHGTLFHKSTSTKTGAQSNFSTGGDTGYSKLSKEYKDLVKDIPSSKKITVPEGGAKKEEIPLSRSERKAFFEKKLSRLEEHDQIHRARTEKARNNGVNSGSEGRQSSSGKNNGEAETKTCETKEKPFGSNKNIHTLGCYQSTSKQVKKKGNFYCFDS